MDPSCTHTLKLPTPQLYSKLTFKSWSLLFFPLASHLIEENEDQKLSLRHRSKELKPKGVQAKKSRDAWGLGGSKHASLVHSPGTDRLGLGRLESRNDSEP